MFCRVVHIISSCIRRLIYRKLWKIKIQIFKWFLRNVYIYINNVYINSNNVYIITIVYTITSNVYLKNVMFTYLIQSQVTIEYINVNMRNVYRQFDFEYKTDTKMLWRIVLFTNLSNTNYINIKFIGLNEKLCDWWCLHIFEWWLYTNVCDYIEITDVYTITLKLNFYIFNTIASTNWIY